MRQPRTAITGICLAVLFVAGTIAARAQEPQGPSDQQKALGVSFVRTLASAEMTFYYTGQPGASMSRFTSLQELQNHALVTKVRVSPQDATTVPVSVDGDTVPGYHLDLVVSSDGQSFAATLHDTNKADHGFMIFIDQHGVIYFGQALR